MGTNKYMFTCGASEYVGDLCMKSNAVVFGIINTCVSFIIHFCMMKSKTDSNSGIISVGEEIATQGLPAGILYSLVQEMVILTLKVTLLSAFATLSPSQSEIFDHSIEAMQSLTLVDPRRLPELFEMAKHVSQPARTLKRVFQADYYAHPEHYNPLNCSICVLNCLYSEKRFPRLLTNEQPQDLMRNGYTLVGLCDISCDIGGSLEVVH
ncbi:hypothetical protein PanWU01x14_230050 [Parasponia andersonii]|uniref:Uncharacterized protein n=1 Tax=Parasponia andersonii TaxID=3476 RepID=A0A2P5BKW5_PARAD|nr:hypothetical protein PanWU01x14_230050 [Parasponia andersonii]